MTKLIVLLLVSVLVCGNARHIHPHGDSQGIPQDVEIWKSGVEDAEKIAAMKEVADVEVLEVIEEVPRHLRPNRFMPLNNALFFMGHQPCPEEGFKRDYMGICREVWD